MCMLKYFLKPLGLLDIIVIVLILTWFLLLVFNKSEKLQILIFSASHIFFYIFTVILDKGNIPVLSVIILLVSFVAFIINCFKKRKERGAFLKNRWLYCCLTIFLVGFFFFWCILLESSSILMPPPH